MSRSIKQLSLIIAMLGMVLVGVAHANTPNHEINDCAICIYQPLQDSHSGCAEPILQSPPLIAELPLAWATPSTQAHFRAAYLSRAPPVSA